MEPDGVRESVLLAGLTTLGVGGAARWLVPWRDAAQLRAGLAFAAQRRVPWWLLGGGSNVIIADAGLPGVVLQPTGTNLDVVGQTAETQTVAADAGLAWDALVAWTVSRGLGGIECLSGIPGLLGSAPIQNIGAYGQDVAEVIAQVEVLDTASGRAGALSLTECAFGYRDSALKRAPGRWIVTRVWLRLHVNAAPCLKYAQLADALAETVLPPGAVGLERVRETVLQLRRAKGMVVDPEDPDSHSVGSFFINPLVDTQTADAVRARLAGADAMPTWRAGDRVKLSAAWLIEHSGMHRGFGTGRVGLSTKHTLALVNRGGATAVEVLAFADEVATRVHAACGVPLQREPVLLGF